MKDKVYLSLKNNIDANKFIHIVQNLLRSNGDLSDCILKIEIVKILPDNSTPRIEHSQIEKAQAQAQAQTQT